MSTIAIDYDLTYTADSSMFRDIINIMMSRGHLVIIATGRKGHTEDMDRDPIPEGIPIIYCGNEYKTTVCDRAGYKVDIWIDDIPSMIEPSLLIANNEDL